MKEYEIFRLFRGNYDILVLCMSHESLLSYLKELEKEPLIAYSTGVMLVDQLLITGNTNNRYIALNFSKGHINISSCHLVLVDDICRKTSSMCFQLFYNKDKRIENSILTDTQKEQLRLGHAI